ncbi:MAG: marC integral rane family protein [Rhodocyclaceae bacterium]|nr:marC integral rane family protein [Rhodocyclaceae bacterium]
MDSSFLSATLLLFLILDPFGNAPVVVALLQGVPPRRRGPVVLRECLIAYGVLLVFLFFGQHVMGWLQLSQTSLSIAGGVVLFLIALRMIFPEPGGIFGETEEGEPLVVPLAVPAIAGPSAMAMVMLMASREPERLWEWSGALTLAMALSTVFLLAAARLIEILGPRMMTAMGRLTGLILSVIAVEMLVGGIRTVVKSL